MGDNKTGNDITQWRISSDEVMNGAKIELSKLVFESVIQGCQRVKFKGLIQKNFIFNKEFIFLFFKSGNIVEWAILLIKTDKE
jgi:hypothetical protein